jgi:hypothetical protein
MMTRTHRPTALVAVVLAFVALPAVLAPSAGAEGNDLIRALSDKPVATVEDGCRMMLWLARGTGADEPFDQVTTSLKEAGLIRDSWLKDPQAPLRKGQLAYMVVRICQIRGGVTMMLSGRNERYSLRECIFLGLLERGPSGQYVSGLALLGTVGRAEVFMDEHPPGAH